jgi:adenine-specific DNA-methyltransferase
LDEVFGPDNECGTISFAKTVGATSGLLPGTIDYIVWYARDRARVKYRRLFREKEVQAEGTGFYAFAEFSDGTRRRVRDVEKSGDELLPRGARLFYVGDLTSARVRESHSGHFHVEFRGETYLPSKREWSTNRDGMSRLAKAGRIETRANSIGIVRYLDDFPAVSLTNSWPDTGTGSFTDAKVYVVQTGTKVIQRCMLMTTDPGDLVLDPTCGSGTTAYVAEQWGRRWITLDTSRVAIALARTRLMAARYPYYLLADTPEGQRKERDLTGTPAFEAHLDGAPPFPFGEGGWGGRSRFAPRLRLQARSPHHPQIHRQQRGD